MTTKAVEVFKKEFPALANSFVLKPFQEKVIENYHKLRDDSNWRV